MLGTLTCGLVQCSRMDAVAVNGDAGVGTNGGLPVEQQEEQEQERLRMRPADVDADMREMSRRKRVDAILTSKTFRSELDRLVEAGLIDGSSVGGCLQHISDMMGLVRGGIESTQSAQCVQPIADLRGAESSQFTQQEKQMRCRLASLLRVMDQQGWAPPPHSHVTVRLSDAPDHLLVNPYGLLYGEVTASSLLKVDLQGNVVHAGSSGLGLRTGEFSQLAAVHAARPELRCLIQVRAAPVVAVSALRLGLLPLTEDAAVLGPVSVHTPAGGSQPARLAADLGDKARVVLLQNRGALCGGETVEEAFFLISHLVAACGNQVRMLPLGADCLLLLDDVQQRQAYEAARRPAASPGDDGAGPTARPWRLGELQFEAKMRQLDTAGFRTGHVYRQAVLDADAEHAAPGYSLDTDDIFKYSPMRKMVAGARAGERTRWLNQYQKTEINDTTSSTVSKVADQ